MSVALLTSMWQPLAAANSYYHYYFDKTAHTFFANWFNHQEDPYDYASGLLLATRETFVILEDALQKGVDTGVPEFNTLWGRVKNILPNLTKSYAKEKTDVREMVEAATQLTIENIDAQLLRLKDQNHSNQNMLSNQGSAQNLNQKKIRRNSMEVGMYDTAALREVNGLNMMFQAFSGATKGSRFQLINDQFVQLSPHARINWLRGYENGENYSKHLAQATDKVVKTLNRLQGQGFDSEVKDFFANFELLKTNILVVQCSYKGETADYVRFATQQLFQKVDAKYNEFFPSSSSSSASIDSISRGFDDESSSLNRLSSVSSPSISANSGVAKSNKTATVQPAPAAKKNELPLTDFAATALKKQRAEQGR
ncbi:MAG: hypothetical protein KDK65_02600 [Chlamydiia bacterium]|nr:hypothetical protein [Chlamydiia bacterium]